MTVISFELPVQPRTKKTSNRIVRLGRNKARLSLHRSDGDIGTSCPKCRTAVFVSIEEAARKVLPSDTYEQFALECMWFRGSLRQAIKFPLPITGPVAVKATFYRAGDYGDLLGYEQALADVLQAETWSKPKPGQVPKKLRDGLGLIVDDKQIRSWDGSRLEIGNPRIEIEIAILGESQERLL